MTRGMVVMLLVCLAGIACAREEADWDPVPEIPLTAHERYHKDLKLRHQRRIVLAMRRAELRRARLEMRQNTMLSYQLKMYHGSSNVYGY